MFRATILGGQPNRLKNAIEFLTDLVIPEPDDGDAFSGQKVFPYLVSLFPEAHNHGRNHPVPRRVSKPDNRNPGRTGRPDVIAGICNRRNSDFANDAREYARNLLHSCGDNGRGSLGGLLNERYLFREEISPPLTSILSPSGERKTDLSSMRDRNADVDALNLRSAL